MIITINYISFDLHIFIFAPKLSFLTAPKLTVPRNIDVYTFLQQD